jgi:chemotaxis protein MotB
VTLLTDSLLFDTGNAEIRAEAVPLIQGIARAVRPFPNLIRVEGHTDNVPLQGGPYKTNWGLSTMRATNVAEVIIKGGHVDAHRLSVLGYGDTRQKVPNTSDSNRQKNRRVEITILKGRNPWGDQN